MTTGIRFRKGDPGFSEFADSFSAIGLGLPIKDRLRRDAVARGQ
jgi:hypothetical protein